MKQLQILLALLIFCANATFGVPRVKLVTEYITPNMLATNSAFTSDSTVSSGLSTVAKGTYVYLRAWNFGDGTVMSRRGDIVEVSFDGGFTKRLALNIAPLTIIAAQRS